MCVYVCVCMRYTEDDRYGDVVDLCERVRTERLRSARVRRSLCVCMCVCV